MVFISQFALESSRILVVRNNFCLARQKFSRPWLAISAAAEISLRLAQREKDWRRPVFLVFVRQEGFEPPKTEVA